MISKGNLNKSITFTTVVTEKPFVGLVNGQEYKTNNNLAVYGSDGVKTTKFSSLINAGPQDSQSVAAFVFYWEADTSLPAGNYATTNTISISVN